jgi:hypothetical protein
MTLAGREACSLAATRHGAYVLCQYGLLPRCEKCPPPIADRCQERQPDGSCPMLSRFRAGVLTEIETLFGDAGHLRASDRPLVHEYVKQLGLLLWIDLVLEADGPARTVVREVAKDPKGKPGESYAVKSVGLDAHPLMAMRETVSGKVFAYAEQLGLSPMGRKKLELTGRPVAKPVTLDAIAGEKQEREGRT